jgi:hypothetical protein
MEALAPTAIALLRSCYVWLVSPPGYAHTAVFAEVAEGLSHSFKELGGDAPVLDGPARGRTPIVLGSHQIHPASWGAVPADAILVNLEPLAGPEDRPELWRSPSAPGDTLDFTSANLRYQDLLVSRRVLDYSTANVELLAGRGGRCAHLPLGYSKALERVVTAPVQDIDVLFYGSGSPYRGPLLRELSDGGLKVVHLSGVYGPERDALIGRSKVVLNLRRAANDRFFEFVRVSYLLNNRVCVVSEDSADPELEAWRTGLRLAPYSELVKACRALVADAHARQQLSSAGYDLLRSRPQSALLARALNQLTAGASESTRSIAAREAAELGSPYMPSLS